RRQRRTCLRNFCRGFAGALPHEHSRPEGDHGVAGVPWSRSRCRRRTLGYRSEEHTSELQSLTNLVCRLLLENKKIPCGTLPDRPLTEQARSASPSCAYRGPRQDQEPRNDIPRPPVNCV